MLDFDDDDRLDELDDRGVPTYTVCELVDSVNGLLRRTMPDGVWVRGEIQGWYERGPHAYFKLVEDGPNGRGVLNVQFFGNARQRLRPVLRKYRLELGDGLKVRLFGYLDLYAPSGTFGLKMSSIDPRFTLGELSQQRDDVIRRLIASGVFDANRARTMPVAPLRLGVVTSVASAAWADFASELTRSGLAFQITVADVRVQGDVAVPMVSGAIRALSASTDLDVLVVIRGGGAKTELATFDAEPIALAIATSPIPVLTGLGHEIDRSVADEVAHQSYKTPTACAAALVESVREFVDRTETAWTRLGEAATRALGRADERNRAIAERVASRTASAVDRGWDRLARRADRLRTAGLRALDGAQRRVDTAVASVGRAPARLDAELRHLSGLESQVRLVDPVNLLARGWSITRDASGRAVRSATDLAPGDRLVTTFATGVATSTVDTVQEDR
jgi:exodeoxyribonuclease VII large subunit